MSADRKVRVRYRSGRMKVIVRSVLPEGRGFRCQGIAVPTARIVCTSCDINFYSSLSTEIQVSLGMRYVARCRSKIVTAAAPTRMHRFKIDVESIVSEIQDFRGTDLDRARRWWHRNKERLTALLPLTFNGVTYTAQFPNRFEEWLHDDKASPSLREVYVFRRLRKIQLALHQSSQTQH